MSEFRIYPLLEMFLQKRKFCVQTAQSIDLRGSLGFEADIVGIRKEKKGEKIFCIEVKENDFNTVLRQACLRICFADYIYIAFPFDGASFGYVLQESVRQNKHLEENKIGLLFVDELRNKVFEVLPAYYQRYKKTQSLVEKVKSKFNEKRLDLEKAVEK